MLKNECLRFLHPRFLEMEAVESFPRAGYRRLVMPLSSDVSVSCGAGETLRLKHCNWSDPFFPERLLIRNGADWRLHGMGIDGVPWIRERGVHGQVFAPTEPGSVPKRKLVAGDQVYLSATYHGAEERGTFEACLFGGTKELSKPSSEGGGTFGVLRAESEGLAAPAERVSVRIVVGTDCWPHRLDLSQASDWVVNDVLVDEESILLTEGWDRNDLPGEMFADGKGDLRIGKIARGGSLLVEATYVGSEPGARLRCELRVQEGAKQADDRPGLLTFVSLTSGCDLGANFSAQITARPQVPRGYFFEPQCLVVQRGDSWGVRDVKIGNRSQFTATGLVPGVAFSASTVGNAFEMDLMPTGLDLRIDVMNVGQDPRPLIAGVAGTLYRKT